MSCWISQFRNLRRPSGPLSIEIQRVVGRSRPFGLGSHDELVGLSFPNDGKSAVVRQHSISGLWYNELRDLYLCIQFPEPQTAECMSRLLNAAEYDMEAVALEWKYADFLEQQSCAGSITHFPFVM